MNNLSTKTFFVIFDPEENTFYSKRTHNLWVKDISNAKFYDRINNPKIAISQNKKLYEVNSNYSGTKNLPWVKDLKRWTRVIIKPVIIKYEFVESTELS